MKYMERGAEAEETSKDIQIKWEVESNLHRSQRKASKEASVQNLLRCCVTVFWLFIIRICWGTNKMVYL
jgi:hypothetical protein